MSINDCEIQDNGLLELCDNTMTTKLENNGLDLENSDDEFRKQSDIGVYYSKSKSSHGYKSRFNILKSWEGVVLDIQDEVISSKLFDPEDNTYAIHEFDLDDVDADDKQLLKRGALFFLYLGYYKTDKGPILKSYYIKFRRFHLQDYINDGLDSMNNNNYTEIWG